MLVPIYPMISFPAVAFVCRVFALLGCVVVVCGVRVAAAKPSMIVTSGADVRLRDEYSDGIATLSTAVPLHEQNQLRLRLRAWTALKTGADVSWHLRAVAEPRYWTRPSSAKTFVGERGLEERFALLDELNFQWRGGIAGSSVGVTLGRQELKLGEAGNAWLINDATPGDGSWTTYFDAARATVKFEALSTSLDMVFIDQYSDADRRLPTLGRSDAYAMTEQDEQGVVVYFANRALSAAQFDAFFIFKKNHRVLAAGNDAELSTLGLRVAGDPSRHWQYALEGAIQGGSKQDAAVKISLPVSARRDVRAWGVNSRITWLRRDAYEQRVSLIGEFLSGDDPETTERDELFDVLWGRNPRFSDIVATTFTGENAATYQAGNLARIGPEWSAALTKQASLTIGWQRLLALEAVPTRATRRSAFSQDGQRRGDYFRIAWRQRFTKNVSGLLLGEALKQGDFYTSRDTLTFVRAEILLVF
jgi:hypothetical protein